jgi:hypothetical protein
VLFGEAVSDAPVAPVFQAYVPGMGGLTDAVMVPGCPAQTVAELTVTVGEGLMVTVVLAVPIHPPRFTVTVYVPAFAAVALGMVGFCREEVKPLGPVHEYVP